MLRVKMNVHCHGLRTVRQRFRARRMQEEGSRFQIRMRRWASRSSDVGVLFTVRLCFTCSLTGP